MYTPRDKMYNHGKVSKLKKRNTSNKTFLKGMFCALTHLNANLFSPSKLLLRRYRAEIFPIRRKPDTICQSKLLHGTVSDIVTISQKNKIKTKLHNWIDLQR